MDFGGGSPDKEDGRAPKVVNDEDLLLDNFYKKAGQTSALGADLVVMPPAPMTLPKQSSNQ